MNQLEIFQEKHGLAVDGILGPNSLAKMQEVFCIANYCHMAHFAGQIAHETANFYYEEENLNYSTEALLRVFGKYFPNKVYADHYARQPEKIANRVYANRMGNGNEASGDGWKYRGRGAIQLTGKNNYEALATEKKDYCIVKTPEVVLDCYFFDTALFYFSHNGLWFLCDRVNVDSITQLTRRINGGVNGLQDRVEKTMNYYEMLCS